MPGGYVIANVAVCSWGNPLASATYLGHKGPASTLPLHADWHKGKGKARLGP